MHFIRPGKIFLITLGKFPQNGVTESGFFPGEKHELHPTKQINLLGKSVSTPSIVVHIADEVRTDRDTACNIFQKLKKDFNFRVSPIFDGSVILRWA